MPLVWFNSQNNVQRTPVQRLPISGKNWSSRQVVHNIFQHVSCCFQFVFQLRDLFEQNNIWSGAKWFSSIANNTRYPKQSDENNLFHFLFTGENERFYRCAYSIWCRISLLRSQELYFCLFCDWMDHFGITTPGHLSNRRISLYIVYLKPWGRNTKGQTIQPTGKKIRVRYMTTLQL